MATKKKVKKLKKTKEKKSQDKEEKKDEDTPWKFEPYFEENREDKGPAIVKCGKPVLEISYGTIKFFTFLAGALLIINIIFSIKLIIKAIKVRVNFGYFINLISKPDGDILPTSLAIPTFLCLVLDIIAIFLIYKLFSEQFQHKINFFLFLLIMIGLGLVFIIFIIFIFILAHIYSEHESLHDGMTDAMKLYGSDSKVKAQIDRLQIQFQCCGSKKYEEWYEIQWYDASLVKGGNASENSSTPFSCCSKVSIFPCIHHDIEKTGTAYLYTPEFNLSISTNGCYEMIRERKKKIGWALIGNMFILVILQILLMVSLRFLQTGHFERGKYEGRKQRYTIWLFGCYRGKGKQSQAPEPPPVPPELMDDE